MRTQKVLEFIELNKLCSEYLFEDWETFLNLLYAEGESVSAILWWDHCKVAEQHKSIGGGGYHDPKNPEYMYAETHIYENGLEPKSIDEIKEYIAQTQSAYQDYQLVPSFYLNEG